jgi:hypothetical protein
MKILTSRDDIKNSNLVVMLSGKEEMKRLDFLSLNNEIVLNIDTAFEDGKNNMAEYFLGGDKFKKLYVIFYLEKSKSKMAFLGDTFRKLPQKLTILS